LAKAFETIDAIKTPAQASTSTSAEPPRELRWRRAADIQADDPLRDGRQVLLAANHHATDGDYAVTGGYWSSKTSCWCRLNLDTYPGSRPFSPAFVAELHLPE
jgi:hypothetical protein